MKMRGVLGLVIGLAAALAVGHFVTAAKVPPDGGESKIKAEEPKAEAAEPALGQGKRAQAFIAAFNKGDAKAVAAFWTEDATYVDLDGREFKGRPAILKLYEKVFAGGKGSTLKIILSSVKLLSPDVGMEEGITEVTPAGGGLSSAAHFLAVLVKKDGEWYFQSVHDSEAKPPSNVEHFEEIGWLLGDWTSEAEKGKGEAMKASYSLAENKNFIVSTFATTLNDVPVTGGTQWIAWDAVDKRLHSFTFYAAGGFGESIWTQDGDKWSVAVTVRTADGKKVSAVNVITKIDDDHATWQMTKLTVNGEVMPSPKPMKMNRVKAEKR